MSTPTAVEPAALALMRQEELRLRIEAERLWRKWRKAKHLADALARSIEGNCRRNPSGSASELKPE